MVKELKKASPVDTGALKTSIRKGRRGRLAIFGLFYGNILNARGKWKGWRDRALAKALARFNRRRR